jgi:hypothetical protein
MIWSDVPLIAAKMCMGDMTCCAPTLNAASTLWVQEAYGDLICAVAAHHPELVPASRYIPAASTLVDELSSQPRCSRDRGRSAAMHQLLRILGRACHLTAAYVNAVLNFALWDLGECCQSASPTDCCHPLGGHTPFPATRGTTSSASCVLRLDPAPPN